MAWIAPWFSRLLTSARALGVDKGPLLCRTCHKNHMYQSRDIDAYQASMYISTMRMIPVKAQAFVLIFGVGRELLDSKQTGRSREGNEQNILDS